MQKQLQQNKRLYCPRCKYPAATCICASITAIDCQSQVTILQHTSEVKSAKNTARLLPLAIEQVALWVGETADDFAEAQQNIQQTQLPLRVVYPSRHSVDITQVCSKSKAPYHFVLLDGTWKKAFKLWQLNPWLHALPCIHINGVISQYDIRKAPAENCLSTLEAVATCIAQTEGIDCEPLFALFHARQQIFKQYQQQQQ